jgi:hypothetical protein
MRTAGILLVLSIAAGVLPAVAGAAQWETDFIEVPALEMDAALAYSGRPAVADAEGRIHLVFHNNLDLDSFRVGYVSRDVDGTWGTPVVISQPGRNALNATAALGRDGRLHVLWEDVTGGEGEIVHCVRGTDGVWSAPAAIAPAPGLSSQPRLVVDAFNRVHAVWVDNRTGYRAILHSSAPAGGAWEPPEVLTTADEIPDEVVLAADGIGGVHAVWREQEGNARTGIYYNLVYAYLGADRTEPPKPILLVTTLSTAHQPHLAAEADGTLHLVWLDNRTAAGGSYFEIFYKRYLPGIGWGHDKRFTYEDTQHGRPVAAVGPDGQVNIVWEDYREGNSRVYYRQITRETGWDPNPTMLSDGLGSGQTPTLVAFPDEHIVVLWTDALASGATRILAKDGVQSATP